MMSMPYEEALYHLAALGPELRTGNVPADAATDRKFSLEHIRSLLVELGDPQRQFRSILIAGTNGKGSTAATLASICAAGGVRTGLYTSPHLSRVNERMRVAVPQPDGDTAPLAEIPDATFGRLFGDVYRLAGQMVEKRTLPHTPSFFELLTAVGFLFFAEQRVELAVLEVGLGGRLDATNIVEPLVSVITDIGIDHTEFLGNTLTKIAREKAGILRRNGVLVTLSQHPEANAAIGELAVALGVRGVDASRYLPPRGFVGSSQGEISLGGRKPGASDPSTDFGALETLPGLPVAQPDSGRGAVSAFNRNESEGPAPVAHAVASETSRSTDLPPFLPGQRKHDSGNELSPLGRNCYPVAIEGEVVQLDSPLPGQHQQRNLALAVAAAVELRTHHGFRLSNHAIEAGVRATTWPGRLEWLPARRGNTDGTAAHAPLLLDVAHNPAGAWTLRAALAQLPDERPRTLIFSCLADKQIEEMARILWPLFDSASGDPARRRDHIVLAPITNPRAATVTQLLQVARALDIPAHAAPHLPGALHQAEALTPVEGVIVATGSVYLIGDLRRLALAESPSTH